MPQVLFSQEKEAPVSEKRIQGSKELPLELNLLIESLQNTKTAESNREKILTLVMNIDSYARALSNEDIFLVGKIEIYKTLLKSSSNMSKASIDVDSVNVLKGAIKKSSDPFISWFLKGLLHDCESLMSGPTFKEYLLQKNSGHLDKLEYRKIDKKVQLLYRWISKINPDSSDFSGNLREELAPSMLESLKNIEESFYLMALSSGNPTPALIKSPGELKFFALKEIRKAKKVPKKEKTIDEILAPITDETKQDELVLPKPSEENWLNEDNAPINLKNLPKPSDDADWLQDF